jgi:hypothetical protein
MKNKLTIELISIVITVVLVILFLLPIHDKIGDQYPFYVENALFIIVFFTLMRYLFLMKYHWLANLIWVKVVLVFLSVPILMYLIDNVYDFQSFSDEVGIYTIMENLETSKQKALASYIRNEMMFFWTGAFICALFLPIRMIVSLWRMKNRGTV